jgi:hypothetical protein
MNLTELVIGGSDARSAHANASPHFTDVTLLRALDERIDVKIHWEKSYKRNMSCVQSASSERRWISLSTAFSLAPPSKSR